MTPATLWGHPRRVYRSRGKCWSPSCLTITGSRYGSRFVCTRHACEQMAIEQRADQAVVR